MTDSENVRLNKVYCDQQVVSRAKKLKACTKVNLFLYFMRVQESKSILEAFNTRAEEKSQFYW